MTKPKKILVPVDLSLRSAKAIGYAAMLAENLGSVLVLMTNVNLPELTALEEFARNEKLGTEEAAEASLRQLAHEHAPDLDVEVVATFDDYPADGILAESERDSVDMIVVASHGRAGMTRWLLGSVAEKIVRGSAVPVVVVPAREIE